MQQFILKELRSSTWGTFCGINCLYSETKVMLNWGGKARGHLIRVNPGHNSR